MDDITSDFAQEKSDLEKRATPLPMPIPVAFLSGLGKLGKVINNVEAHADFQMREKELEINFDRPVFVTEVSIALATMESPKGMRLVATDVLTNRAIKASITVDKSNGSTAKLELGKVVTSLILHREAYFTRHISGIKIVGMFLDELEAFENEYRSLLSVKQEILEMIEVKQNFFSGEFEKLVNERAKNIAEVASASDAVAELENQQIVLKEESSVLTKANAAVDTSLEVKRAQEAHLSAKNDELEKRNLALKSELEQKAQTLSSTNVAISKGEERLKGLVTNINVFTEEFAGFVEQGTRQVRTYLALACVPLFLLSIVVRYLFNGAVDLSTKFGPMPKIDLLTLFATRLPFVVIAGLIVAVNVKILFFLISRIIAIHQQRLDLAKIAIIAKDVSDASSSQLNMAPDELYESKTFLKMSILRAYLADQIDKFTYASRKPKELTDQDEASQVAGS